MSTHRRPALIAVVLITAVLGTAALFGGCSTDDEGEPTDEAVAALGVADQMVSGGASVLGLVEESEVTLISARNALGAPDETQQSIDVYLVEDVENTAVPLDAVVELWTTEFGFEIRATDELSTYLVKGDWTAEVGTNGDPPGGPGRVWLQVTTEAFDTASAEAAISGGG